MAVRASLIPKAQETDRCGITAVIASEAKQSSLGCDDLDGTVAKLDCFASLAMTKESRSQAIGVTRRAFMAGAVVSLSSIPAWAFAVPKPLPQFATDYAVERKNFRTHLVKTGPSPDDFDPIVQIPGTELISYSSGNLTLAAWRSVPDKTRKGRRPAVLFLHGGNALGDGHWDLVQDYIQAGYVAMMPAVRGENGLPGAFSGFYDETDDVLAAARALASQPDVDPARLFVAGHSVGGTLTLLAALSSPMFRGASSFSGNPSAFAFFRRFPEDIRFDTDDPREFEMRSAACYATSFKCPTMIMHGDGEAAAKGTTEVTVNRAKAAGLKVEGRVVSGDHFSALPMEIKHSLAFFAELGSGLNG